MRAIPFYQVCVILIFWDIVFVPDMRYFNLLGHWFHTGCKILQIVKFSVSALLDITEGSDECNFFLQFGVNIERKLCWSIDISTPTNISYSQSSQKFSFIPQITCLKIKNEYNSEEHLGNLIFKLNKLKINKIRFIFRFYFKPSSETNYKNHYNCAVYTKIRTKPVLWTLLSLCLTLVLRIL